MENHHICPMWLDSSDENTEIILIPNGQHQLMDNFFERICADTSKELKDWLLESDDLNRGLFAGSQIRVLYSFICDPFGNGTKASKKQIDKRYYKTHPIKYGKDYIQRRLFVIHDKEDQFRYSDILTFNMKTKHIGITHSFAFYNSKYQRRKEI